MHPPRRSIFLRTVALSWWRLLMRGVKRREVPRGEEARTREQSLTLALTLTLTPTLIGGSSRRQSTSSGTTRGSSRTHETLNLTYSTSPPTTAGAMRAARYLGPAAFATAAPAASALGSSFRSGLSHRMGRTTTAAVDRI